MDKVETTLYWDDFYRENDLRDTSSFFEFVSDRVTSDCIVLDIGCGTARDTISFTSKAAKVVGVDASKIVIERNQANYNQLYLNVSFVHLDISDADQLDRLFLSIQESHPDKKLFVYCRFFLHAITEDVEDILLSILDKHLKSGDTIALEFRTAEDEMLYKNFEDHFRRYIDTDIFDAKTKKHHFNIDFFVKSKGLSVYKDEDPYLARYVLSKAGGSRSISLKEISSAIVPFDFELLHRNRNMDRNIAKENLIILKRIFDLHNVRYWLCFGTLLGAVREDNFIEHDVDTDVGMAVSQINMLEAAVSDLKRSGFEFIRVLPDISMVSLLRKNEYIDIYMFRKIDNDHISWRCNGYIVKEDYFSNLTDIHFLGEQFSVPCNYIRYLEEVYGQDWKIPKQNAHAKPINITEETYKQYYLVLNKWLELSLNGGSVGHMLVQQNRKKIIVYGLGNIGKRLIQDIEKSNDLEIVGVMDGAIKAEKYGHYDVIIKEQIRMLIDITIIVTPFYYLYSIKEELLGLNSEISVIGIDEIIK